MEILKQLKKNSLYVLAFVMITFLPVNSNAQPHIFATLDGSPTMNTAGWNLLGSATVGNTNGTANNDNDELILTPPSNGQGGSVFYQTPLDLSLCNNWIVEFDYRIWDGNGADGIAFNFLANPPTGAITGAGIGIPPTPLGLMVILDTFNNCNDAGSPCCTPKLQIRYGDGVNNYSECPPTPQPTLSNLSIIRQPDYNRARVVYDDGNIDVYINNTHYLSGFYQINYAGYLGFSSSTGGSNDRHSIKNVVVYTDMPISDAGQDQVICSGETIQIGASPRPDHAYSWNPVDGLDDPTSANPTLTLTNQTTDPVQHMYVVTTDSAGIGCVSTDTVFVTVNPVESTIQPPQLPEFCVDASPVTLPQDIPDSDFSGPGISNNVFDPAAAGVGTHDVLWQYIVQGCLIEENLSITVNPLPDWSSEVYDVACYQGGDGEIHLTMDGDPQSFQFEWSDTQIGNQSSVTDLETGTYAVTVTDANGCVASAEYTVNEPPALTVSLSGQDATCYGYADAMVSTSVSGGTEPYQYAWSNGGQNSSISQISAGSYTVTVTDQNNCQITDSLSVFEPDELWVEPVQPVYEIKLGVGDQISINYFANGNSVNYLWSPMTGLSCTDCQNPHAAPFQDITYDILITDEFGCQASSSVEVVVSNEKVLFIPSAFSPNDDGENDVFYVYAKGTYYFQLRIFDRWGTIVYESDDINEGWDGTYNGKILPPGVYVYTLYISFMDLDAQTHQGSVLLFR